MALRARLPGVRFETVPPPPADVLPRTDVAAFVGFASAGPLHVPVPVEDPAAFAEVFGADARLAWDPVRGAYQTAHLGPAVRAFFRNGGRRCWVIRTAGPAAGNAFEVPGLTTVADDGSLHPAVVRARSEGSWSDNVRVAATLVVEPVRVDRVDTEQRYFVPAGPAPTEVRPGDLFRLTYPDGGILFCPVSAVGGHHARWERPVWLTETGSPTDKPVRIERLTFELWVRRDGEPLRRLGGLGFTPQHARYWGGLPTDAVLFGDGDPPVGQAGLWADAASPRFALAGGEAGLSLPVDMPVRPVKYVGPIGQSESSLERDGLAHFGPGLFLGADDPAALRPLVEASAGRLLAEADYIRWSGPDPRPLRGIYAVLGVEEATLLACPDAVHRGWSVVTPAVPAVAPAKEEEAPPAPEPGFAACDIAPAPPPEPTPPPPDVLGPRWEATTVTAYEPNVLFAVHRALLRLCAARGDLLAVLALPEHYRESPAADHATELASPGGRVFDVYHSPAGVTVRSVPLNPGERTALSFGAVYHPWLLGREETDPEAIRRVPPDGSACGVMARRAVGRGPWVAPANERLRGVVGLAPDLRSDRRLALQEARVNLVRQEPRGFLTLSADTLSPDDDLREINVRRLLILLRRLALRVGADYAFEPNTPAFRRSVRRGFEEVLGFLFTRGAFAGRSPAESFRVIVDDTVNPLGGVELGRFVVELRVAPSRPLAFLTVRLVQAGERGTVAEVR